MKNRMFLSCGYACLVTLMAVIPSAYSEGANESILKGQHSDITSIKEEEVRFVGVADQKEFYAIYDEDRPNWFNAVEDCQNRYSGPAEITSLSQSNVIKNFYESEGIRGAYFWIGGRDALDERQFVWNSTDDSISTSASGLDLEGRLSVPGTCLTLTDFGRVGLMFRHCSERVYGRICELHL